MHKLTPPCDEEEINVEWEVFEEGDDLDIEPKQGQKGT